MMFAALTVKERRSFSVFALVLLALLTGINIWELAETRQALSSNNMGGVYFFKNMVKVDAFNLWFNTLMSALTLLYVGLMHRNIERVGLHVGEYYALIFFILSGIYLMSTFNNLLILSWA